ncbi:MAG: prepilin-type N-terminal cleavage/methylation domain-containing protein [Actinobacteria bacterium]|nr:prepilin-type N-terminal cleavage/methylation domain-containing protein [Actinomycetota bacterium]
MLGRTTRYCRSNGESGFTLIELLVVIVIIAILAAIAIPMYLRQREKAWEANVKSDLYNAAVAEIAYEDINGVYTGVLNDLFAIGYNQSAEINISIPDSGAGFCLEAFHNGSPGDIWHVDEGAGTPMPLEGSCP